MAGALARRAGGSGRRSAFRPSYLHFYPGGQTIAYADARSHLLIARRVLLADTPGAGQLGRCGCRCRTS